MMVILLISPSVFAQPSQRDCRAEQHESVSWSTHRSIKPLLEPLDYLISSSEVSTLESPWKGTGLNFDYLQKKMINTSDCYLNETSFVACVTALGTVVQYSEPGMQPVRWVPLQLYFEHSELFGKTKIDSELGLLAEIKPATGKSIDDTIRYYNHVDRILKEEYLKMYRKGVQENSKIDFNRIFNRTKNLFVSPHPEIEEELTAAAWISFLKTKFDPHTRIVPVQSLQKLTELSSQTKASIGVSMDINEFGVFLGPQPKSPAEQAGVLPGDRLVALEGKPVIRFSSNDLETLFQKRLGKEVRLTVNRGGSVLDFKVRPTETNKPDFSSSVIQDGDRKWSYLKLGFFPVGGSHQGCEAIATSLKESAQMSGTILDLRGNPGGAIDEAKCIASHFLGAGKLVSQILPSSYKKPIPLVTQTEKLSDAPLVVLVDNKSASASELLSGTLQEHGRAVIVGDQTYGKGSFQSVIPLSDFEGVNLVKTEGLYYLPSGRSPQLVGVTPDFRVLSKPGISQEVSRNLREVDSGSNPLPANVGVNSVHLSNELRKVESCVHTKGRALSRFQQEKKKKINADYQLLFAQDVLNCFENL